MSTATIKIAPSILAANFAHLGDDIQSVESAGAHQIHVDVMDGHFVPNISMGPVVVEAIRRVTELPLDVHLMISQPAKYVDAFAQAGANALTFHVETVGDALLLIKTIKSTGMRAGVALKPGTSLDVVRSMLSGLDIILLMTVEPGFGGQQFLNTSIGRIKQVREWLAADGSKADLTVDGGINAGNARDVIDAGATVLVAGSSIFKSPDGPASAVGQLLELATET